MKAERQQPISNRGTPAQAPEFKPDWALFLDVDGTLLDLAPRPDQVQVNPSLVKMLGELHLRTGGAIALISGRPIAELDRLFDPLHLCMAGQHGMERRDAEDKLHYHAGSVDKLNATRRVIAEFKGRHPGIILEDKSSSLAVHYRLVPELLPDLEEVIDGCMKKINDDFQLQSGKMVFEIKPRGRDKGTAIDEFMQERPFRGRRPVFIGDDVTDEDGFMVVNSLNGYSIKVGPGKTLAKWSLTDAAGVQKWLQSYNEFLVDRS